VRENNTRNVSERADFGRCLPTSLQSPSLIINTPTNFLHGIIELFNGYATTAAFALQPYSARSRDIFCAIRYSAVSSFLNF